MSFDISSVIYSNTDCSDTLREIADYISKYRHPLEDVIPIGSLVKLRVPKNKFVDYLRNNGGYDIYKAYGIADVVYSNPCEVIGISDLTDTDGKVKTFVTIMDSEGCAYPIPCDMIKVFC